MGNSSNCGSAQVPEMCEAFENQQQGILYLPVWKIPIEIWATIFSYLSSEDLAEVRLVCRDWYAVTQVTELNEKRCLRISPANLPAIKDYCQLTVGRLGCVAFMNVELSDVQYSEDLVYVLRVISRHIRHLQLLNSDVLELISGKFAKLRSLELAGSYTIEQVCQLRFHTLHHLRSIDLLSLEPQIASIGPSVLAHVLQALNREITEPQLRNFAVQCSAEVEHLVLVTLRRHAPTLTALTLHFSDQVAAFAKPAWIGAFRRLHRLNDLRMVGRVGGAFAGLLEALQGAPLKSLCLSGSVDLTNETLVLIGLQWRHSLNSLDIGHCGYISDMGLCLLSSAGLRLRTLVAAYCFNISDVGLRRSIGGECNARMRTLNLEGVGHLQSPGLKLLLLQLPLLQTLVLANCSHAVTDCVLTSIFSCLTHLKQLILADADKITDKAMVGSDGCAGIRDLRLLEKLDLSCCRKLTDVTLRKALCFAYLRHLDLGYLSKITESGIRLLVARCPAVQALALNSCWRLDDAVVNVVVLGLRRLRVLDLSNCPLLTERSVNCLLEHGQLLRDVQLEGNLELAKMYRHLSTDQPNIT